jgi:hypothetical protein
MEGNIEQIDSQLARAKAYLESSKRRMRVLFAGVDEGKFAKEYDATLALMETFAVESVDGHYRKVLGENMPDSDDFKVARMIAIADCLREKMAQALQNYQDGKGIVPPSEDR